MNREKNKNLIFYEIYPTSFYDSNNDGIGDLEGIRQKLPYIKDLGFNAIWLNPCFKSPFKDGGYDIEDFFDIDPKFGTLKDLENLLDSAHEMGIKIILDLVAGHASEDNKDFLESAKPIRNDKYDLFIWNNSVWENEAGYRLIAGRHQRNGAFMVNFFAHQPAFNYGFNNIEYHSWQIYYKDERTFAARNYMLDVMRFYLKMGADGFRVDMADSLVKNDPDKSATIDVWRYMFNIIRKEYPDAFFVAEWSYPHRAFAAGFDCDFVLDHWDNFYHRLARSTKETRGVSVLNGGDLSHFIRDLNERVYVAKESQGLLGIISGNHDTPRVKNFLDESRTRLFYLIIFALPGIPFVLYGDEIMMESADIPSKDGGFSRTGSRTPMQWDESVNAGFSKTKGELYLPVNKANKNNVKAMQEDKNSIYYFIKELINIRKNDEDLLSDDYDLTEYNRLITIKRGNKRLVINLSDNNVNLDGEVIISTSKEKGILTPYTGALIK